MGRTTSVLRARTARGEHSAAARTETHRCCTGAVRRVHLQAWQALKKQFVRLCAHFWCGRKFTNWTHLSADQAICSVHFLVLVAKNGVAVKWTRDRELFGRLFAQAALSGCLFIFPVPFSSRDAARGGLLLAAARAPQLRPQCRRSANQQECGLWPECRAVGELLESSPSST